MSILEKKINALLRYLTAEGEDQRMAAVKEISDLSNAKEPDGFDNFEVKREVRKVLLTLGVPDALKGYSLLATALELAVNDPELIHNITGALYPAVAARHDDTPGRVERAIRHAIEVSFDRCDVDVLQAYFGNTVSAIKGKPTNGEFIARAANVIRDRLMGCG